MTVTGRIQTEQHSNVSTFELVLEGETLLVTFRRLSAELDAAGIKMKQKT